LIPTILATHLFTERKLTTEPLPQQQ